MDAVRKIVETEGQARKIVEEAKTRALEIISRAREDADRVIQEATAQAQQRKEEILMAAKQKAEVEARQSDLETEQLLGTFRKLSEERKDAAVSKAVELVLGA